MVDLLQCTKAIDKVTGRHLQFANAVIYIIGVKGKFNNDLIYREFEAMSRAKKSDSIKRHRNDKWNRIYVDLVTLTA